MSSLALRCLGLLFVLAACKGGSPSETGPQGDEDGDGFSPPADCDETDPNINPDAVEVWNDGVDADCDGEDRGADDFVEFPLVIAWGEGAEASAPNSWACDLNGDGAQDLLLAENRSEAARLLAFEGPFTPGSLVQTDADWEIQISNRFDAVFCTDHDGDGADDIVIAESADPFGQFDTNLHLLLQPAGGFDAPAVDDAITLTYDIGFSFTLVDLNGDGLDDLAFEGGLERRMLLAGTTYTAGTLLDASVDLPGPDYDTIQGLDDLDGDGTPELLLCVEEACDIYGPIDGAAPTLLTHVAVPLSADVSGPALVGDFDGDGTADDLVTSSIALGFAISVDAGAALAAGTDISIPSYTSTFRGTNHLANAGDVDGDGADDLLHWIDGTDGDDRRLYSGKALTDGERKAQATLLQVARQGTPMGNHLRTDLDGDGTDDVVFLGSGNGGGYLAGWLSSAR